MKYNNSPYDEKDWKQIVENAFAPNTERHVFSAHYQDQKRMMGEKIMSKHTKFQFKKPAIAAVAIVAAAAILVPSTAFAVSQINAYMNQSGTYQQDLTINTASNSAADTPMALQVDWIPEGMTKQEGGKYQECWKYHDTQDRGITMYFWKIADASQVLNHTILYTISQEQFTCGDNTVLLAKKAVSPDEDVSNYNEAWVTFPDKPYAVQMSVSSDITDAEIQKIAENLSLTPAEAETASVWTGDAVAEEGGVYVETIDTDNMQVVQVGDVVETSQIREDENVSVQINDAILQDNLDGLTTDGVGNTADYSAYLNADGTLKENVRTWYTYGDGVNTLDTQDHQETVPQKVLILHLTYTNNGTEPIEECICPSLFAIADDGSVVMSLGTDDMYAKDTLGALKTDRMAFSFATTHSYQKNNLTNLASGESAEVTLAFLVDADNLEQLYLNVLGYDISQGAPVLDLRHVN